MLLLKVLPFDALHSAMTPLPALRAIRRQAVLQRQEPARARSLYRAAVPVIAVPVVAVPVALARAAAAETH
ncbi:MAG: hypothetical protein ACR2MQ_15925 [Gemmatimonadaceae bacterium]